MTMSSIIQEMVLKFLSDKQEHSVQEIKHYLKERDIHDYTEGQFCRIFEYLNEKRVDKKGG